MTLRTLTLAAIVAALGAPALAGGLAPSGPDPIIAAPPPPAPDRGWTGPYVGAQLGWGWASIQESGDPDIDGDGYVAGVHAGYNFDFGRFVMGIELDYNLADISFDDSDPDDTITALSHLKLRGGYDAGRTLFYVAGGAARAKADGGASGSGTFYGLGVEHRFTDRLSGGVEYLMHDFEDFYSDGIDLDLRTLQARLSFRF
jgi:opacity protein-like surface antigen